MEELKETEANPWVLLGREEMAGGGGSAEHGSPVNCVGGNGAPVGNSRREIAGQVHKGEAELVEGLG